MRSAVLVLVVVAVAGCGGKSSGAKSARAVTCKEASIVLGAKGEKKVRDPKREVAIASVCERDRWSKDVIKCVLGWPEVEDCLVQLSESQRQRYIVARVSAREATPGGDGYGGQSYGGGDLDPYGIATMPDPQLPCPSSIGDLAAYDPPIKQTGADKDFALGLRRIEVADLCDDGWDNEVRQCFASGNDVATCRGKLDGMQEQELADRLADNDALIARVANLMKKPASIDCKKVVAVHYADANWTGKLDGIKPGARKKMIAESRTRMKAACTGEAWAPLFRACVVGDDSDRCMVAAGIEPTRWGFPAAGIAAGGGGSTTGLYDRLGGQDGIAMIVEMLIQTVAADDRINAFFASADVSTLEAHLTTQLCVLTGGPCTYGGRDMKTAHHGMGIAQAHVDAFVDDLTQALAAAGVGGKDADTVLGLYKAMAPDVVTP